MLMLSAGAVVLTSSVFRELSPPAGQVGSLLLLWAGLFGAAIYAVFAMRPVGILSFRGADVVWALAIATLFRLVVGVVHGAERSPFPIASVSASQSLADWAFTNFVFAGLAGPLVEESFFRLALLPVIFMLLVPRFGALGGGVFAVFVSAAGFAALHIVYNAPDAASAVELFVLGFLCSSLVLLTGRVWGAVLLHVSYNVVFLAFSVAGFVLS